jgi:hypothetical protein
LLFEIGTHPMLETVAGSPMLVALYALAATPPSTTVPVLEGEIHALAIAGDRVAAIRRAEVVVFRASGEMLGRLDHEHGPTPATTTANKGRASAEDVLDLAGIPDDDLESDVAEEALDDEGAGARRRAPTVEPAGDSAHGTSDRSAGAPRLLAASEHRLWIGGADGLATLAAEPDAPALPLRAVAVGTRRLPLSALAVAPGGDDLAALAGNHVLRSSDGGSSWSLLAVLAARPRAIEISADGSDVFLLDDDGVAIVAHRQRTPILDGRAYHLVRCGDELLILAADGVYAWRSDRGLEPRSARIPARRLACAAAAPDLVLALGSDLYASLDGGRTWRVRDDLPAPPIDCLAIGADRLWVGTASGLFVVPLAPPARSDDAPPDRVEAAPIGALADTRRPPPSLPRASPWAGLLPRVALVAAASATRPGGDRREVWLLLTFPLGRARPRGAQALQLAADRLRRRAALSAELAGLAHAATADEEAAEMLRVVRASLEAVR